MANNTGNSKKKRGAGYDIWRALKSNKLAVVCMIVIAILALIAIFADVLVDYEEIITQDVPNACQHPSKEHPFGTDGLGRDYLGRILYATRVTLIIALSSVAIASVVGILIGGLAAWYGGWVDTLIMRILDIILSVPQTLFIICVIVVLGNETIFIILTLVIACVPPITRCVRAEIMVNMQNEYIEAARSVGSPTMRTMVVHLIPNSFGTILVRATAHISGCILSTASLGYLGLGVKAPAPEWGRMLSEAQEYMRKHSYLIIIPGLFILVTATVFSLFGDALRDAMDPRLRGFRKFKGKSITWKSVERIAKKNGN